MKPIETGVAADDVTRDGARLARAAADDRPLSMVAPITLPHPLAPLAASRLSSFAIDLVALDLAVHAASEGADVLIVEGAGGLLVPVTERASFDTLFARWSLGLVVVAANRLGVINHVRLTCAAARRVGLPVRAVVLNHMTDHDADTSVAGNAQLIAELEGVPVIRVPWTRDADDLDAIAALAEETGLADLLAPADARSTTSV
jgi:dethiobiotin synthetase